MSRKNFIGVFDSGVGGLTVLAKLKEILPNENYYYIADEANCPYGTKPQKFVGDRVEKITKYFNEIGAKMIVIACNTASLQVKRARDVSKVPVIEVITPTAKYAFEKSLNKEIGVIATNATVSSHLYKNKLEELGAKVIEIPCSEFVDFIEENDINDPKGQELVNLKLSELKNTNIDTLIYGCTHFSLLEDKIINCIGNKFYISCGEAISNLVKDYLKDNNLENKEISNPTIELYTTGEIAKFENTSKFFTNKHELIKKLDI